MSTTGRHSVWRDSFRCVCACVCSLSAVCCVAGSWCWLTKQHTVWRIATWSGPFTLLTLCVISAYVVILHHAQRQRQEAASSYRARRAVSVHSLHEQSIQARFSTSLMLYPLVFLICWTLPVVSQIVLWSVRDESRLFPLLLFNALTSPLLGFLNMLVFYREELGTLRNATLLECWHRSVSLLCCH